ncbi:MAG: response regulator [Burkholderiaceae bacterium]|nr:response regulator [Burkholderiaceae bacterium]
MSDPSIRVLIVDDHDDAAESLAIVLSTEGFEVRTDNDGADAWQTIRNWRPSVALIDLDLPSIGGLELARRARTLAFGDQLLLAALTGYGRDSDRKTSRQAGFDTHMVKPVDPNEVLRWIATASVNRAR